MAKINYVLSKKSKDGLNEIYIDFQPKRLVHYRVKTGIFISETNFERLIATNKLLTYDCLYLIEKELMSNMPVTKTQAEQIIHKIKNIDDNIYNVFLDYTKERIVERGLSEGTQEIYRNLASIIKRYDDISSLKALNQRWLAGLINYMCDNNISNTTQATYWRVIKTFLNHLVEQNSIDRNTLAYKPKFKVVETDVISLSVDELNLIYSVTLNERLSIYRDIFIVQCLTGLRYSDMTNIYKENIQEDDEGRYITLITKKTMKRLKIYFNGRAEFILGKYDWTLPHPQVAVINKHLPTICKEAGIKGRIETVKIIGNKRIIEYKEKYEVIKTHTARRTFISLMLEAGEDITTIRSITGHAQLSSFGKYVSVSDKKKSSAVNKLDWW